MLRKLYFYEHIYNSASLSRLKTMKQRTSFWSIAILLPRYDMRFTETGGEHSAQRVSVTTRSSRSRF
jgi:hypothetical protein